MSDTEDSKWNSSTPEQNGGDQFNHFDRLSQIGLNSRNANIAEKALNLEEPKEEASESYNSLKRDDSANLAPLQQHSNTDEALSRTAFTITVDSSILRAGQNNSLGYYFSDANGAPISGKLNFSNANDALGGNKTVTIQYKPTDIPAGAAHVGFFLIPNGGSLNSTLTDGSEVSFQEIGGIWTPFINNSPINNPAASSGVFRTTLTDDLYEPWYISVPDFLHNSLSYFRLRAYQLCLHNIHPSKTRHPIIAF